MSASITLEDLERRLTALQDIEDIESLKARYWRAVDRKRPDDVAACLTEDAIIDFEGLPRFESREDFMAVVREAAANPNTFNMHHGQNPVVALTGKNTATGEWDVFYYGIDVQTSTLVQMAGAYSDRYVRKNGQWFIAATAMRQTSIQVQSTAPRLCSLVFGRAP